MERILGIKRVGREVSAESRWNDVATSYAAGMHGAYHQHRREVICRLLPELTNARVLEFGCGTGVFVTEAFARGAASVIALDANEILLNKARASVSAATFVLGRAAALSEIPDRSHDCILALNVLGYLSSDEERLFYSEAKRILVADGSLVITHSNSLFDLFTLNRYTIDFFQSNFGVDVTSLLREPQKPDRLSFNIRENPLAYEAKLSQLGFKQVQQEFMNYHAIPPLLSGDDPDDMERVRANTLDWPADDRWRLAFQCSMFGVRAICRSTTML
jgi:ubiquinone/menaquinone biosynthesis C-methylase UbiE